MMTTAQSIADWRPTGLRLLTTQSASDIFRLLQDNGQDFTAGRGYRSGRRPMMPRLTITLIAAVTLASTAGSVAAQGTEPYRRHLTFSFAQLLPEGHFLDAIDSHPFGGSFSGVIAVRSSRLSVGGDSQLLWYGDSQDMIGTLNGLVRLHARVGPRRPYLDAIAGIRSFSVGEGKPTYSYGVGVGMQFDIGPGPPGMMVAGREVIDVCRPLLPRWSRRR
jgi:hypothetical protein